MNMVSLPMLSISWKVPIFIARTSTERINTFTSETAFSAAACSAAAFSAAALASASAFAFASAFALASAAAFRMPPQVSYKVSSPTMSSRETETGIFCLASRSPSQFP